jgi:glycerol-3-phosphate dehydrogenase (NAD(P)+)
MKVAVIGAGSWGTTVAALASTNATTVLWARDPRVAASVNDGNSNPDYLPSIELPPSLSATSSLEEACTGADVVVMGVPSHGFRAVLADAQASIGPDAAVISLSKGLEQGTILRMTQVIGDVLADHPPDLIGVLSGPNLAKEVALGQPTASVVALENAERMKDLQVLFMTRTFRVYTNPDVVGCEIAGALKNVIAIAAGIAHGLGYGDNTKAALITRGLAELARLGMALGGDPLTFSGLAGMGDLVATCTSDKSRNRTVGVALGQGRALDEIVAEMKMVAEGVKSTEAVLALGQRAGIELPIAEQVGAVLYEGRTPAEIVPALMLRQAKAELGETRQA